jgi:hypothetical protein
MANDNNVEEIKKIDAERVLKVLAHDVAPAEEGNASSRGDLSAAWKIIEDECGCNKAAAKQYYKLSRMSEELRDDYLRTLYTLMEAGGIGISQDLVDKMKGQGAPTMPTTNTKGLGADNLATIATQREEDGQAFDEKASAAA